ncbi:MAG TPA: riboflavin synthase [Rhizobiales bacterium]|nr:riboflavin synthase [bacterium BMS3Bbin10]HDO52522.1 riboflavin synthase [Hyphomicrobiales bacterium]
MFTGLITDIGEVRAAEGGKFQIACGYGLGEEHIGSSIACNGCCLTVTNIQAGPGSFVSLFWVDVSNETLARTTLGAWAPGAKVNLERSLTPSGELGGHMVTGHVDAVASIVSRDADGDSVRFEIQVDDALAKFIAAKGSVALNGVSLTVNEVAGARFTVNLIPHTLTHTTWGELGRGDNINLEVDLLARYVARIMETRNQKDAPRERG